MACYQTVKPLASGVLNCPGGDDRLSVNGAPGAPLKAVRFHGRGRVSGLGHVNGSWRGVGRPRRVKTCSQLGGESGSDGWTTFHYDNNGALVGEIPGPRPVKAVDDSPADREVHETAEAKRPLYPVLEAHSPGAQSAKSEVHHSQPNGVQNGRPATAQMVPPEVHRGPDISGAATLDESAHEAVTPGGGGGNTRGPLRWIKQYQHESTRLAAQVKAFGLAGVLSYGIFNTLYYLTTFLFVWFYVAPSPGGLGLSASAQRFGKLFAMVWAGSQVTKLLRAGCALALAPLVDKGLDLLMQRYNFKSRGLAFGVIVGGCFGLVAVLFLVLTGMWA